MKEHIKRELVNDLRDIGIKYHNSAQLRSRIGARVQQALKDSEEWVPPIKTDPYAIYPEPSYVPKPSRPKQIVQRSKEDGYVALVACMTTVVLIALILIASRR